MFKICSLHLSPLKLDKKRMSGVSVKECFKMLKGEIWKNLTFSEAKIEKRGLYFRYRRR